MWSHKTTIEPVKVGTLDMIKKRTDKHIHKVPGRVLSMGLKNILQNR